MKYLTLENLTLYVNIYALAMTAIGIFLSMKKSRKMWRSRFLRKVWGIKDGDFAIVICSELDEPDQRQNFDEREFIYNLKYGDVDAYFEVVITLLRLYPNLKLKVMSAGEAEVSKINLAQHLILIGGPDYNSMTEQILKKNITKFTYRSPYVKEQSVNHSNEIVIYDKNNDKEFCEFSNEKDYGYFERVKNHNNPDSQILLFGGCHTIGVTGAVKAFSMADSEYGEIPKVVLDNAKLVAKTIKRNSDFSILVSAERLNQTIGIPLIKKESISINYSG